MSKISENGLFGQKKAPAGWFHSKTKVVRSKKCRNFENPCFCRKFQICKMTQKSFSAYPKITKSGFSKFIEFYRKISIFIEFDIKIAIFRYNLGREYSGICLQPLFCCGGTRQGLLFAKKSISQNFGHGHFSKNEFSSKTLFLGHLF